MAKTLWDINFSTLNVTNDAAYQGWDTKYTNTDNLTNGVYKADGQGTTPSFALNAIDIDWNGATLDSTVIRTTGDLLKYIKAKSNLTLGTTATTAAKGNHTHQISITTLSEDDASDPNKWLVPGNIYNLTAGGSSYTFGIKEGKSLSDLFTDEIQKWMTGKYSDQNLPKLQLGNAGTISLPKSFFDLNNDNTIDGSDILSTTYIKPFAMGFIADYAKNWYGKTPSEGIIYTQGTNITINSSNQISHKTPSGAASGNKGNKANKQLLAQITTDSQGHVTGYEVISPEELWNLVKQYADALYEPKSTPSTASASIGSEYITRPKNSTLKSISWSNGSATSPIESGKTGTLTKGTVTATYGNDDATTTIITSGCTNNPTITSDNPTALSVGTIVKNGTTILTAKAQGTALITVKDGSKLIGQWGVTINNETNTSNVTSSATFSPSAGSINGTTITAPTVTADTTVTITCAYGDKTASQTVTYTAKKATPSTTYYYSAGTTEVTSSNYTSANNAKSVTSVSSIPSSLDISTMKGYVYIVLPTAKEPNVNTVDGGLPNISIVATPTGHKVYKVKVGTNATLRIVNAGSSANLIQ